MASVDDIFALFVRFGGRAYGEKLSLESHMLQTAAHAQLLGAAEPVLAAALLHDIGYFLHPDSETSIEDGRDIGHEALGAAWLSQLFDAGVTGPVALHVDAKRYLCAVEPDYFETLSDASRASLMLQGGAMRETEMADFRRQPAFEAAVLLRRADDLGKDDSAQPSSLEHYRALLARLARR